MPGTKTSILRSLVLFSSFSAAAVGATATPEYFPLQPGSSWVYRGAASLANTQPQTISVEGTERFRDTEYARVQFFGRPVYLRQSGGTIYAFDTAAGRESVWLQFDAPDGQSVPVEFDPCTRAASIASREAKITTPAGEWANALQFAFEPSCADAGFTTMYFVPGVGPVAYETTSIAGPIRYELTYSRSAEAPQTSFTVALDAPAYKAAEVVTMQVRLTLRTASPVLLTFPSGQRFDLRLWNDRGEIVYTWSADKLFAQVLTHDQVGPGEKTFAFRAEVPNPPPGRYLAEAWLATQSREYTGTVGVEVVR